MKKTLIFAGVVALVGFGIWYAADQYKKLTDVCFNFDGYDIQKINRERITILVKLKLKNKSDLAITLTSYDFNIFMNGAAVSRIRSNKAQLIKSNSFTVLSLLIDVEPKNVKSLANWDFISQILLDVNNVKIKIQGTIGAHVSGIGVKSLPISVESKLKDMRPDPNVKSEPCI